MAGNSTTLLSVGKMSYAYRTAPKADDEPSTRDSLSHTGAPDANIIIYRCFFGGSAKKGPPATYDAIASQAIVAVQAGIKAGEKAMEVEVTPFFLCPSMKCRRLQSDYARPPSAHGRASEVHPVSYRGAPAEIVTSRVKPPRARSTTSPCDSSLKKMYFGAPSCGSSFFYRIIWAYRARDEALGCVRSALLYRAWGSKSTASVLLDTVAPA